MEEKDLIILVHLFFLRSIGMAVLLMISFWTMVLLRIDGGGSLVAY